MQTPNTKPRLFMYMLPVLWRQPQTRLFAPASISTPFYSKPNLKVLRACFHLYLQLLFVFSGLLVEEYFEVRDLLPILWFICFLWTPLKLCSPLWCWYISYSLVYTPPIHAVPLHTQLCEICMQLHFLIFSNRQHNFDAVIIKVIGFWRSLWFLFLDICGDWKYPKNRLKENPGVRYVY